METIVTIAGSDSGGGAGIQADLKTISANGAFGLTVLTSVTAQNTRAVTAVLPMPPELIEAQFAALFDDFSPSAAKSGMLADAQRVQAVAAAMQRYSMNHYVLDPVMVSTSGHELLEPNAVDALKQLLVPLAEVVTPNVREAQLLADMEIRSLDDAREAATRILKLGCRAVLITGGHLSANPGTDILLSEQGEEIFEGEFIDSTNTHGTGCTFSSAIATHLGLGADLPDAVRIAKCYVTEAIRHGPDLGSGSGPTDHFYFLNRKRLREGDVPS